MSKIRWYITVVVLVVIFLVPVYMIVDNEKVGLYGTEINLEIKQYDPYDYFRGRYLNIRPLAQEIGIENLSDELKKRSEDGDYTNDKCYITFKTDTNGMSFIDKVSEKVPSNTNAYIVAELGYDTIDFGIDKFFINEKYSMKADDTIRNLPESKKAYLKVKILDGKHMVEDLMIDDKSIYEYLDAEKSK